MLKLRINYALVFSLLLLNLTGCVSGTSPAEQYTSPSGVVTPIATDQESCKRACNADFSRCQDSNASRRSASDNAPADLFGASADCRDALKKCLPRCKGR